MAGLVGIDMVPLARYGASKGALVALTRHLAVQWSGIGVRANALAPGWVVTDMSGAAIADQQIGAWVRERTPLGRPGTVEDLDDALMFLVSPASRHMTGQVLSRPGLDGWVTPGGHGTAHGRRTGRPFHASGGNHCRRDSHPGTTSLGQCSGRRGGTYGPQAGSAPTAAMSARSRRRCAPPTPCSALQLPLNLKDPELAGAAPTAHRSGVLIRSGVRAPNDAGDCGGHWESTPPGSRPLKNVPTRAHRTHGFLDSRQLVARPTR
jgi:hypothetical protein